MGQYECPLERRLAKTVFLMSPPHISTIHQNMANRQREKGFTGSDASEHDVLAVQPGGQSSCDEELNRDK